MGPTPLMVKFVTEAPDPGAAFEIPAQLIGLGTVMVMELTGLVPVIKAAKLPLVKTAVEAVKFDVEAQFAVVVSQVPLFGVLVPLLSHHCITAALAL